MWLTMTGETPNMIDGFCLELDILSAHDWQPGMNYFTWIWSGFAPHPSLKHNFFCLSSIYVLCLCCPLTFCLVHKTQNNTSQIRVFAVQCKISTLFHFIRKLTSLLQVFSCWKSSDGWFHRGLFITVQYHTFTIRW